MLAVFVRIEKMCGIMLSMYEILKTTLGFILLIFIGLVGVFASQMFDVEDSSATVSTVDNTTTVR